MNNKKSWMVLCSACRNDSLKVPYCTYCNRTGIIINHKAIADHRKDMLKKRLNSYIFTNY
jgi:hypothetical protein